MRDEKFKAVSTLDPALNMTVVEVVQYMNSRDFSLLKFLPGEKPTVFHLREVPHGLWESYVAAPDNIRERHRRAFEVGVERVENVVQTDGVAIPSWSPTQRIKDNVVMSSEEAELFAPSEREEIGSVIYTHSFLPRRIRCSYQLPPSLAELLPTRTFRPADVTQPVVQEQSSAKPSASSSPNQDATAIA